MNILYLNVSLGKTFTIAHSFKPKNKLKHFQSRIVLPTLFYYTFLDGKFGYPC